MKFLSIDPREEEENSSNTVQEITENSEIQTIVKEQNSNQIQIQTDPTNTGRKSPKSLGVVLDKPKTISPRKSKTEDETKQENMLTTETIDSQTKEPSPRRGKKQKTNFFF